MAEDEITPPAEGQNTTTAVVNNPPKITQSDHLVFPDITPISYVNSTNASILSGFTVDTYYAVIDIDGDNMTMGWDLDLNGVIDIPVNQSSDIMEIDIPIANWNDLSAHGYPTGYYHSMIAFIAIDEHGLGSSLFYEFLVTTYTLPSPPCTLPCSYVFDGEDANGAPGTGTADNLIRLTMTDGENINWANLKVQIEVDNAAPVTCDNPGQDSGAVCVLVPFEGDGGQFWGPGDGVTVQESGQDVCAASCTIDVTITDTREGKVIDTTENIPAEADQA